ncbi:hypothetical protein [Streptomyces spinosirectus]
MTTRLISNRELWREHLEAGRRDAVVDWLQANGLDPLAVLNTHDLVIESAPGGGQQIRCHVTAKGRPCEEEKIVPLVVKPPLDWPVHTVSTVSALSPRPTGSVVLEGS